MEISGWVDAAKRTEKQALRIGGLMIHGFKPLRHLWPWLLANILLGAFFGSSQGQALSLGFAREPLDPPYISLALSLAFWVTLLPAVFTTIAVKSAVDSFGPTNESLSQVRFVETLLHGAWAIALASGPSLMFAMSTGSGVAYFILANWLAVALIFTVACLRSIRRQDNRWEQWMQNVRRHRFLLAFLLIIVAAFPLTIGALITVLLPSFLSRFGPLLVAMIGLCSMATLIGTMFIALPACASRPWIGFALAGLLLWYATALPSRLDGPNPLLQREKSKAVAGLKSVCQPRDSDWLRDKKKRFHEDAPSAGTSSGSPARSPFYIVTAEGGGIRAAYWTAASLAELSLATGGQFGAQIGTLSGVSGGSLGIATWLASQTLATVTDIQRAEYVRLFLGQDHLSPLVAGFLFLDVPRLFLGPAWLPFRRDQAFERAIATRWQELTGSDFFFRPLTYLCVPNEPLVVFSSTDALTGRNVELSNEKSGRNDRLTIVEAVHMSARFPYLSPGAEIAEDSTELVGNASWRAAELTSMPNEVFEKLLRPDDLQLREMVLVDGGYYDNSALSASRRHESQLDSAKFFEGRLLARRTVHLSNNPDSACIPITPAQRERLNPRARRIVELLPGRYSCSSEIAALERSLGARPWQWITTPAEAMLAVRESHAQDERRMSTPDLGVSVSNELTAAYGRTSGTLLPTAKLISGLIELQERDERALGADVSSLLGTPHTSTAGEATAYLEQSKDYHVKIQAWKAAVRTVEPRIRCVEANRFRAPPLGWTLNADDRELLSCLAVVAAVRVAALPPPIPRKPAADVQPFHGPARFRAVATPRQVQ